MTGKPQHRKVDEPSGWFNFNFTWARWVSIVLAIIYLTLYIVSIFTASHFPECYNHSDCFDPSFTCEANGRCSCTYADFTPDTYASYRPYRCDPAGISFHVDPVLTASRIFYWIALVFFFLVDIDVTHYLAHTETIHELIRHIRKLEQRLNYYDDRNMKNL